MTKAQMNANMTIITNEIVNEKMYNEYMKGLQDICSKINKPRWCSPEMCIKQIMLCDSEILKDKALYLYEKLITVRAKYDVLTDVYRATNNFK